MNRLAPRLLRCTAPLLFSILVGASCGTTSSSSVPVASAALVASPTVASGATPDPTTSPVPNRTTPSPSRFQSAGPRSTAGPSNLILEAQQVSADAAWVLTDKAVVRTVDGGLTWLDAKPPGLAIGYDPEAVPLPNWNVRGIGAINDRVAYLATDASTPGLVTVTIWRTSDGGATWATSSLKPITHPAGSRCSGDSPPCPYRGTREVFDVVDAAHAFVTVSIAYGANLASPQVFATSDGGATWRAMALPAGSSERLLLVQFATASAGMIGMRDSVPGLVDTWWGTEDGGNHWVRMSVPPDITAWQPATFWDSRRWVLPAAGFGGWSTSAPGPFLFNRTNDGGNTWMTTTVQMAPELIYGGLVRPIDPANWIAVAETVSGNDQDVWATMDSGSTWAPIGRQPRQTWPATFVDASHGWARGIGYGLFGVPDRALFATDDGGRSWRQLLP